MDETTSDSRTIARKSALVIGNANYIDGLPRLATPVSDSRAIASALTKCGCGVTHKSDISREQLAETLGDLARASPHSDLSILYFSGSGFMYDGQSYIVPVDATVHSPASAVSLAELLTAMQGAQTKVLILDTCQESIDPPKGEAVRLPTALPPGALVVFSAEPNSKAMDRLRAEDVHSPFAIAVLERIQDPGLELRVLFDQVRDAVRKRTRGEQQPMILSTLQGARDFWLASR